MVHKIVAEWVSTGGGAAHTLRGHQHLGDLQTRNRLLIHNAHGPQGVKHGLMHMVPSNVTHHMHPVDGDIMKHMNVVRPRLLFGLHTVVTVRSVGVQGRKSTCSYASLAMLMHSDACSIHIHADDFAPQYISGCI